MGGNNLNKNILAIGITILFLCVAVAPLTQGTVIEESNPPISKGNVLYVGGSGEGNYTSIQDAIDNASDGDTVFVYSGIYYESRIDIIGKSITLKGENKHTTIIDGSGDGEGIFLLSNYFSLNNLTVRNFGWSIFNYGLRVGYSEGDYFEHISISDCIFRNQADIQFYAKVDDVVIKDSDFLSNRRALYFCSTTSNFKFINCNIKDCGDPNSGWGRGLSFWGKGENVTIRDCTILNNFNGAIDIDNGVNVDIYNNEINGTSADPITRAYGIRISRGHNVSIHDNIICKNGDYYDSFFLHEGGIGLFRISSLEVYNNTIANNLGSGIDISCDSAIICGNNLTDNIHGIFLSYSNNNTISGNLILKNENGIVLYINSSSNIISGNLISKNKNGTYIRCANNIISGNIISENENGIKLRQIKYPIDPRPICNHKIERNNFLNNNRNVFFRFEIIDFKDMLQIFNKWNGNYWGRSRLLPKPIFGTIHIINSYLPIFRWVQFDWRPAQEPYDI